MSYFYSVKGDTPELLEGKSVLWCEQDTFFIESAKKLTAKGYTAISKLPEAYTTQLAVALREAKDAKCAQLNKACDECLKSFTSDALGEIYTYDLDTEDQINYMGLAMASTDAFMRCYKVDENGELVGYKQNLPHTKEQILKAYSDGAAHKIAQIAKCGQLKEQVEKATSLAEIAAIEW